MIPSKRDWVDAIESNADLIVIGMLTITDTTTSFYIMLFAMNQPTVSLAVFYANPKLLYINSNVAMVLLIIKSTLLYMACFILAKRIANAFNNDRTPDSRPV